MLTIRDPTARFWGGDNVLAYPKMVKLGAIEEVIKTGGLVDIHDALSTANRGVDVAPNPQPPFPRHSDTKRKGTNTYASQTVDGNDVQKPQKHLVPHKNGTKQVPQNQGAEMVFCVGEAPERSHDDARQIEQDDKGEELAVRVEPQLGHHPLADLLLWPWRELCWCWAVAGLGRRCCGIDGVPAVGPLQGQLGHAREGRDAFVHGGERRPDGLDLEDTGLGVNVGEGRCQHGQTLLVMVQPLLGVFAVRPCRRCWGRHGVGAVLLLGAASPRDAAGRKTRRRPAQAAATTTHTRRVWPVILIHRGGQGAVKEGG